MFALDSTETRMLLEGRCGGVVRRYHGGISGCPHAPKSKLTLTSKFLDGTGRPIPFGTVEVISVRPGTMDQFSRLDELAQRDGYRDGKHLRAVLARRYPGMRGDEPVVHLSWRVVELDRQNALGNHSAR